MKQKWKRYLALFAVLAAIATVAFWAAVRVHAFDTYYLKNGNNLIIEVKDKMPENPSTPGVGIRYEVYGWYMCKKATGSKTNTLTKEYYDTYGKPFKLDSSSLVKRVPENPGAGEEFYEYYCIPEEKIVPWVIEWYKDENGIIDREKLSEGVTIYLNRIYRIWHDGQLHSGPHYDYNSIARAEWWSQGALDSFEKSFDKEIHLAFKVFNYDVQAVDNNGNPIPGYEAINEGIRLYGENIGGIDYPGEIEGYVYDGYEIVAEYSSGSKAGTSEVVSSGASDVKKTKRYVATLTEEDEEYSLHVRFKYKPKYSVTFEDHFYTGDTYDGQGNGASYSYSSGYAYSFTTGNTAYSYNGVSGYYCKKIEVSPTNAGLSVNGLSVSGTINGDVTIIRTMVKEPDPTPTPTPAPTDVPQFSLTFENHFYTGDTYDGQENGSSYSYVKGHNYSYTANNITSYSYNGTSGYYCKKIEVSPINAGLSVNGLSVSGTINGNVTIIQTMVKEPPHECTFVWGDFNTEGHWYVCKECGKESEVHAHVMVATGEADENGSVEKTCECDTHPECDYTEVSHKHEWIEWAPDEDANDYYDDAEYWEEVWQKEGYAYNPNLYHWKYCKYETCEETKGKKKHVAGELEDAGNGYIEQRCKECGWLMYQEAITVSLTINPNGGKFPDGSTEPRVLADALRYYSLTDLGCLGSEHWVTFEEGYAFVGYYIVEIGLSECVYSPDQTSQTLTADSKYFTPAGDGKYWSKLTRNYVLHAQKRAAEYIVHYDSNGGTGTMLDSYYKVGETKALHQNGFRFVSKITYDNGGTFCSVETNADNTNVYAAFKGWSTAKGGNAMYADKQLVTDLIKTSGTVNLYAVWDYGSIILPNAISADGGKKLSGWETPDGTVISVLDASGNYTPVSYRLKGGDETLTAVWIANSYQVSFETYGGTKCAPIYVTYMDTYGNGVNSNDVKVGIPGTSKDGFKFNGWLNKLNGDSNVQNSTKVTIPGDHTLYAQWIPDDVTVTLDYNFTYEGTPDHQVKGNASVKTSAKENFKEMDANTDQLTIPFNAYYVKYGLPKPTMDGYQFVAWYKEEDKNGNGCGHSECLINIDTVISSPGAQTIYARWIKDRYRVDLDYNYDYTDWEE